MSVWPFLWGLCAVLGLVSVVSKHRRAWQALAAIFAAYVSVKAMSLVFGDHGIYLAAGALIWAITARAVFRLGHTTPSRIILLSTLCYFWAAGSGAPRIVGSIPFVVSDLLMVAAMVWIGRHGIASLISRTGVLDHGGNRDMRLHSNRITVSVQKTPR